MLMALPGTYTNVRAANQVGLSNWSPFGPATQNLIITSYGDFTAMFTAFSAGSVDVTDWPLEASNLNPVGGFCDSTAHPDYFCTSPTSEFGIFQLDINSHPSVMGVALENARTTVTPSATTGSSAAACSTGFGSLTVTLQNQETGNSAVQDAFNTITAANQPSGSPSATVSDSGNPNPTGTYQTPCLLAGNYKLSSSIYNATGAANVVITSGQNTAVTLKVNWFSNSKFAPTAARTSWGKALSHLLDRPSFNTGFWGTTATTDSIMAAPAQGLLASNTPPSNPTQAQIDAADCPNLIDAPATTTWLAGCGSTVHLSSAYNIVADSIAGGSQWWQSAGGAIGVSTGYSGQSDLRAACDYFQQMGFAITPSGSTCNDVANAAAGTVAPSSYPHLVPTGNIVYYVRTSAGRKQFGTIIADSLDFLFGTPTSSGGGTVCWGPCPQITPKYYTISQVTGPVFQDMIHDPNGWALYTGGYGLTPTPDHLYALFNSQFTGAVCAGPAGVSQNYHLHCDPQYDTDSNAAEFSSGGTVTTALFNRVALDGFNTGMDVPVYSRIDQFVELNGWNFQQCTGSPCAHTQSSIINTLGAGTQTGFFSLLNMRQVPGYVPGSSVYTPGGGNPNLIRRGFSQDTGFLSPYIASTVWEFEILSQIMDSMLALNPLTGGSNAQLVDWGTTSHSSTFNALTGITTQVWHLRNDLKFQDGNPVTANDVAYTIISDRDVPSQAFASNTAPVISAVGTDCGTGQPCKTLQVTLQGQSPFFELNIGGLPLVEKSLWAPVCGDPVSTNPASPSPCANPSFDPMAAGIMLGDGPWNCVVPAGFANAGHIGGSCFENADGTLGGQASAVGGKWLLTRNPNYVRCCPNGTGATTSSLYKISYADKNNDGVVNILDLADAAVHFGAADPYWVNPNIAPGTTVNIQDLATVAFYFGHGITSPFAPSALTGVDPQIDPFNCPSTGC
jgi:hypothetical protein